MVSFRQTPDDRDGLAPVTDLFGHRREGGDDAEARIDDQASGTVTTDALEADVVRALGRRGLTEKEVRERVLKKGGSAEQSDAILTRMIELRYVDDERIAEELVHRLSEGRGKSRAVIAREMSSRGIAREIVDGALDGISDEHEQEQATELARQRAAKLHGLADDVVERRLMGYLARRGYSGVVVREAISAVHSERTGGVRFN